MAPPLKLLYDPSVMPISILGHLAVLFEHLVGFSYLGALCWGM